MGQQQAILRGEALRQTEKRKVKRTDGDDGTMMMTMRME
jgi:hypothetical protein